MSAGTLTLKNNSAAVAGAGTALNTELAAGDFIVVTVGGVPYTLPVKSVESATALTLVSVYTGPTQSGAAWSAVPRVTLNMVTAALVAQSAEALRGLNYDKQNWQQVFSGAGTITVKLPDSSTYTGPSWKYLSENMATKVSGAVPVEQGGTGAKDAPGARTSLGISDKQLNSVDGKSGGTLTSPVDATGALSVVTQNSSYGEVAFKFPTTMKRMAYLFCENFGDVVLTTTQATNPGTEKYFGFRNNGNMTTPGNITCVSVTQTSDAEKKDKIEIIESPLDKITKIRGVTYVMRDSGMPSAGVIAQELIEVLPDAVGSAFDDYDRYEDAIETDDEGNETVVKRLVHKRDDRKRSYTVEYSGVVALCVEAIKELNEKVKLLQLRVDETTGKN